MDIMNATGIKASKTECENAGTASLRQNYLEMSDLGREKLKLTAEKLFSIWRLTNADNAGGAQGNLVQPTI